MFSSYSFLHLIFSCSFMGTLSQQCTQNLTILDDYCGNVRRVVYSTVDSTTQELEGFESWEIGSTHKTVDQVIGLYDVCTIRRNSYISDPINFNYSEWSWKLSKCYLNTTTNKNQAVITVYNSLKCDENDGIIKQWIIQDGDVNNFTDIPPTQNKEEEYWFWWYEDDPDFPGYGNSTEIFEVNCFDGDDTDGVSLNECQDEYIFVYRFDFPEKEENLINSTFRTYNQSKMMDLFFTEYQYNTINNETYYVKDIESQYKLVDDCQRTYTHNNWFIFYCEQLSDDPYDTITWTQRWTTDTKSCNGSHDTNTTRFENGRITDNDCGFIELSDKKDKDNYDCYVRTYCPYIGRVNPEKRMKYVSCTDAPSDFPTSSPEIDDNKKKNKNNNNLNNGEIATIIILCIVVGCLIFGGLIYFIRRSKKGYDDLKTTQDDIDHDQDRDDDQEIEIEENDPR